MHKTTEKDLGYSRIVNDALELAKGPHVVCGFIDSGSEGASVNMATLGFWLEYGTINFEGWNALGITADSSQDKVAQMLSSGLVRIVSGRDSTRAVLNRVGIFVSGETKKFITSISSPENALSTINKKGSSNPLIDTGVWRNSVKHEVRDV